MGNWPTSRKGSIDTKYNLPYKSQHDAREARRRWYAANREKELESGRKRYQKNKDHILARQKSNRDKTREHRRAYSLKKRAYWTVDRYDLFIVLQNNKCAICSIEMIEPQGKGCGSNTRVADHNDVLKKPRALLCNACNMGIGILKHDAQRIESAKDYLNFYNKYPDLTERHRQFHKKSSAWFSR